MSQIQQKINYYQTVDKFIDIFIILLSLCASMISGNFYRLLMGIIPNQEIFFYDSQSFSFFGILITSILTFSIILYFERFFIYRVTTYKILIVNIFKICFFTFLTVVFIDFIFKAEYFYRTAIIFYITYLFIFLLLKRLLFKFYLSKIRSQGGDVKNIVVVGVNSNTYKFIDNINKHKEFGFKVSSIIYEGEVLDKIDGYRYLEIKDINKALLEDSIDEVFIINIDDKDDAKNLLQNLEHMGINYHIVIDVDKFKTFEDSSISPVIDSLYDYPTISFYSVNATYYKLVLKNFFERIFAFVVFVLTLPILIVSIISIMWGSKGNPIFIQERVGLRNRKFKQLKLRTMYVDAEERKKELFKHNEHDGPAFKMTNDPRITFVGKYLRKFSIDELPQLINVLRGEMNLIGPRPPIPDEVKSYKISYYRRFTFKPGITGLWQISGRNDIKDFEDWIKLDLEYIDNWSLYRDFIIALKTIPAILRGTGK